MSRVDEYAPPFMGLDTKDKDDDSNTSNVAKNSSWFKELYSHSNFSMLGIYLNHWVGINTGPKDDFKDSTWMKSLKVLCDQGWGISPFYLGLLKGSSDGTESWDQDAPSEASKTQARRAGVRHGQRIKVGVAKLLKNHKIDNDGCVVYVDNEYGSLEEAWRIYYDAIFEEMRKPGPNACQPVRPGLYARDEDGMPNSSEMLDRNPDLFTWILDHHRESQSGRRINKDYVGNIPDEIGDKIHIDPQLFEIRVQRRNDVSSRRTITNIPVGCQGFLNYATQDPWKQQKRAKNPNALLNAYPKMPTRALTTRLTPQTPWDFDMSFVRDSRYPVASPRVNSVDSIIARGLHQKLNSEMWIDVSTAGGVVLMTGEKIEPDAPLALPNAKTLLSLNKDGKIVMSALSGNPEAWSPLSVIASNQTARPLRRSRAMSATEDPGSSLYVFYIANDLSIQAMVRSDPDLQWSGPIPVLETKIPMIHGFSNLAVMAGVASPQSISIVTISETSHLQLTSYTHAPSANGTSLASNSNLEDLRQPPSLLQGTAIAIAKPHPLCTLIFAVSRTLMLSMFTLIAGQSWVGPVLVGDPSNDKLFAHTRLAVNVFNPTMIQVAAISYEGDPVVYIITFDSRVKTWSLADVGAGTPARPNPELFRRVKTTPPSLSPMSPLRSGEIDARQWSINPFGDLSFGKDPSGSNETVLMIAGSGPDTGLNVLYRRIAIVNEDWYLRA